MANVKAFTRASKKDATLRFRLRDNSNGKSVDISYKSNITFHKSIWSNKKEGFNSGLTDTEKAEYNRRISKIKNTLLEVYDNLKDREGLTSEILTTEVDKILYPQNNEQEQVKTFIDIFSKFIDERKISNTRKRNFKVIVRALQRYELYKQIRNKHFNLTFEDLTMEALHDFEKFLTHEHELFDKYPKIYEAVPETRPPKPRGQNTLNDIFTKLRTFILWANSEGLTKQNAFNKFKVQNCVYGTPYYITIKERNQLYNADLSEQPDLAIQRDIFIFQCMIGCRVGDLLKMTKKNVIKGAIEYVPRKTKEGNPVTVRVPLNATAKEILKRYKDHEGPGLLPFIYEQKYNEAIKEMFALAKINRIVTVINPTTREAEQRPINEIASSHLARRTFVGNLYKQVKDPNLVGALSGHKEGSRAFARYRDIDEDMKNDLVNMLE